LQWVETCMWPFAPTSPALPHVPGQRLAALSVGAIAFRMLRPLA
jgi:hypothetical protein